MATTYSIPFMAKPDSGFRLTDARSIWDAIFSDNAASAAYGIAAAGTTQATATALTSVFNQVDTVGASSGVALPSTTGNRGTPYRICWVINNGASALTVYGATGTTDTINGTAGATGISMPVNTNVIFVSAKGGAWETFGGLGSGTFNALSVAGNITETTVGSGFIQKLGTNARAGTFTLNGTVLVTVSNTTVATSDFIGFSLNTVGGTVGTSGPNVRTIQVGTSFTVAGIAADTSIYNYTIIGAAV